MKRISLQLRLTCMSALLLTISCVILYAFISNSAVMKMDSLESDVMKITIFQDVASEGSSVSLDMLKVLPEVEKNLAEAKNAFRIQCLIITIIIIVAGTALTWFISGLALEPLKKLNRQVGDITANNLATELPVSDSKDEISEIRWIEFDELKKKLVDTPEKFASWFIIAAPKVMALIEEE